jgi:phytoene desaturase
LAKKVLIIGTGLGGLATALRLSSKGYEVEMIEKHHQPGGRLNRLQKDGFTFDVGPSFFSMSYEFKELFDSIGVENPLKFNELNPLYSVYFSHKDKPYLIHKDLDKLALEFGDAETDFANKARKFLKSAGELFHDTEYRIVKRNYDGKFDYVKALTSVPLKHGPKLFKSMWTELGKHFDSQETKVIFSLVAFFLGATFDSESGGLSSRPGFESRDWARGLRKNKNKIIALRTSCLLTYSDKMSFYPACTRKLTKNIVTFIVTFA